MALQVSLELVELVGDLELAPSVIGSATECHHQGGDNHEQQ